ncbi:MAG: phosphatase PAP2 family protein [Parcubacteria group bacterium]|nr:phosphatase PAP2 family protein [Parcubacteria group bacterium]
MAIDLKVFYFFNDLAGQWLILDRLFVFFGYYLPYFLVAAFLLILYFSKYPRREKRQIFLTTAVSTIISRFGFVSIIRLFYQRPRPFLEYQVNQLIAKNEFSFPSGHAAFFFALAMAIYFYNKKWGVWFFAAAVLIALARIAAGIHYPTDILAGAVIGILSACAVFHLIKRYEK